MSIVNLIPRRDPPTIVVTIPTVTIDEYEYDGTTKAPTIVRDTDNTIITGTTSATEVGIYTFTISLKDTSRMIWEWDGEGYSTAPKTYEWKIKKAQNIYGAEWDGSSSPAWSRTDDAANFTDPNPYYSGMSGTPSSPFDDCYPWSEMKIVEDSDLGTLVEIPKFWYKWTVSGSSMKLQIADYAADGFLTSPAHANRGDGQGERDFVYVGRYHCDTNYKSTTGVRPANMVRATARTSIKALKTGAYQFDYAMLWTICMLYLVEFADWDSQACIGYGGGNGSSTENMGYTDSMPYHTGTTQSSRTTYGLGTQYRYIEGLWDNVYDWCEGIYMGTGMVSARGKMYVINNPNYFSDSSYGTQINGLTSSSGVIASWGIPSVSGLTWALYPSRISSDSSYTTYVCDERGGYSSNTDTPLLYVGGSYYQSRGSGLFKFYTTSTYYSSNGCRLMYLPPNS